MKLNHGLHLAYCTNIHRGEDWPETFNTLKRYTLAVRDQVSPGKPYAIGLRLSDRASRELIVPGALTEFKEWLARENCYVFTINGFPYGKFHGTRVKEQVYAPDWTTVERLEYTNRLFEILAQLLPAGIDGSVSTVPCSFKEFIRSPDQENAMRTNLWRCVESIAALSDRTGKLLHLGLEPEPLCYLETTAETCAFFDQLRAMRPGDQRLQRHLGVNYDTCHLAVEFENPKESIELLKKHQVRISKIHLSSALAVTPREEVRRALQSFRDDVYFHQVIERREGGRIQRYRDLDVALEKAGSSTAGDSLEWRIHFHIPLHAKGTAHFGNTSDHLLGILDLLGKDPGLCSHLEMETYTWEVMPPDLKNRDVVVQLVNEYGWTLEQLRERGIVPL